MPIFLKKIRDEMKNAKQYSPAPLPRNPKDYAPLRILQLETKGAAGVKTLTYKSIVEGQHGINYITFVQFFGVPFQEDKNKQFNVPIQIADKLKFHPVPNINENKVALKCSCPDFRFVFEKQLFDNKGLIGNFRKYTRVAGSKRPKKNIQNKLGFCKHVNALLNSLNQSDLIVEK